MLAIDRDTFEQLRRQDESRIRFTQERESFFKRLNEELMFLQSASYFLDAARTKEEEVMPCKDWRDSEGYA